jgi:hypothetical protein
VKPPHRSCRHFPRLSGSVQASEFAFLECLCGTERMLLLREAEEVKTAC